MRPTKRGSFVYCENNIYLKIPILNNISVHTHSQLHMSTQMVRHGIAHTIIQKSALDLITFDYI